ncbi:hypothetical protein AVEN_79080-1 [Araneus ventricosus]|uniref:Uncharacterized protein n=1 Tax=Araneus ventricosus TaxID=182803 RepID=A0A4Y2RLY7_ARAVE|nr:hypothetical protein AVEN_79080-1 [Araneus ventricosus]
MQLLFKREQGYDLLWQEVRIQAPLGSMAASQLSSLDRQALLCAGGKGLGTGAGDSGSRPVPLNPPCVGPVARSNHAGNGRRPPLLVCRGSLERGNLPAQVVLVI